MSNIKLNTSRCRSRISARSNWATAAIIMELKLLEGVAFSCRAVADEFKFFLVEYDYTFLGRELLNLPGAYDRSGVSS